MGEFSNKDDILVNQISLILSSLILISKNRDSTVENIIKTGLNDGNPNTGLFLQVLGNVGTQIDFSSKTA